MIYSDNESDSGYIDVEDSGYINPIITEQSQEKTRTESSSTYMLGPEIDHSEN